MKKTVYCLLFLFCISHIYAQRTSDQEMLFPEYQKGIALLKDGTKAAGYYNYSTIQRQMQYLNEDSVVFTFENPSEVRSIVIGERVFENALKNRFLERVSIGDGFYYIEWGAKWISVGKATGMGHRTQSYGISSYKLADSGSLTSARYTRDDGMTTIPDCSYYVKVNDNFKQFNSASSLAKAIGCCKNELKNFAKREKIDFKNPDDVYRMMMTFLSNSTADLD